MVYCCTFVSCVYSYFVVVLLLSLSLAEPIDGPFFIYTYYDMPFIYYVQYDSVPCSLVPLPWGPRGRSIQLYLPSPITNYHPLLHLKNPHYPSLFPCRRCRTQLHHVLSLSLHLLTVSLVSLLRLPHLPSNVLHFPQMDQRVVGLLLLVFSFAYLAMHIHPLSFVLHSFTHF